MTVSNRLIDILICPVCKGRVKEKENSIICLCCGRKYPVKDAIPVMLGEEAADK
jgi:uncharacterized protein YbaR (Trm112 family)